MITIRKQPYPSTIDMDISMRWEKNWRSGSPTYVHVRTRLHASPCGATFYELRMFEQPAVTLRVKWAAANPLWLVPGLDNPGEAWDQEKSIYQVTTPVNWQDGDDVIIRFAFEGQSSIPEPNTSV